MSKYFVELPLVGSLRFYGIEANSAEEAIQAAQAIEWRLKLADDNPDIELGDSFETPQHAIQGNVSHLPLSHAVAEEEEEL